MAKDINSLYTAIKGRGIFMFLPVIFVLRPGLPQWIPRVVPTFYFVFPIFDFAMSGATFEVVSPSSSRSPSPSALPWCRVRGLGGEGHSGNYWR